MSTASCCLPKAAHDFVCALVHSPTLGIGLAFSAVTVLINQGAISFGAGFLGPLLSGALLDQNCMVGNLSCCDRMNFLGCEIKVANMLPALLVPMVWQSFIFDWAIKAVHVSRNCKNF
jgi:uncharacterized membrane protein YqgA involved in biofilm formation